MRYGFYFIIVSSALLFTLIIWYTESLSKMKTLLDNYQPKSDGYHTRSDTNLTYESKVVVFELDPLEVVEDESVFFIVSVKVDSDSSMPINARQACGIESAAVYHPEKDIYVVIVVPDEIERLRLDHSALAATLFEYKNIKLRLVHAKCFLEGTPMYPLLAKLAKSQFPVEHTSDILRYVLLYKFGGIYLDTDVILLRRMPEFKNYIGAEDRAWTGAGIINFGMDRVGREVAQETAEQLVKDYDPEAYSKSGPQVITNVLLKRCHSEGHIIQDDLTKDVMCDGFLVFRQRFFYGVPFGDYPKYFEKGRTAEILKMLENSTSIHYWNHMTAKSPADQPGIPFYDIAQTHCPRIFQNGRKLF